MIDSFFDYQHSHEQFFSQNSTKITYKKGQTLVFAHEDSPWVFFLLEGYVNTSFGFYDGSERVLGFFLPGMSFAKIGAFFARNDGNLEYIAITDVTVYRVKQSVFLERLQKDAAFNAEYINWLLKVQILLIERIVFLAQPTIKLKILHWMAFMRRYYGEEQTDNTCRIAIPLTHDVISSFVHTTRESVGKALRELAKDGTISIEKKYLTIEDVRKFELSLDAHE